MSGAHIVLYASQGLIDAEILLDRAPYEALVTAVLAWQKPNLTPGDFEQIALQLTGHARAVAADVQRHAAALPKNDGRGALAEVVLREADGRLSARLEGTARCAQNRARFVQAPALLRRHAHGEGPPGPCGRAVGPVVSWPGCHCRGAGSREIWAWCRCRVLAGCPVLRVPGVRGGGRAG